MVQQLKLHVAITEGMGSIPGQGNKILQAMQRGQEIKKLKDKSNNKKIS